MNMQMTDFLTAITASIDHNTETILASLFFRQLRHEGHHFT